MVHINWNPNNTDLRKFGVSILIGFGIIGGIFFWRDYHAAAQWIWIVAGAVGLLALAAPPLSKPFYVAWMGIAFVLGTIVSTIILTIIFFGIFMPIGLFMRLIGRDALKLKKSSFKQGTYWTDLAPVSRESYERLF